MPIFLNANLTIKVIGNFTGVLFISTVLTASINSLARYLTIEGETQNKNNHTVFGIRVNGCTARTRTKYISVIGNALVFENCLGAYVSDCTLTTNASSAGALTFISSNGKVENCEINNSLSTGILVNQGSVVNVVNNTGVCVNAHATLGGVIIKSGTRPSGNEVIQNGGAIFNECRGNEPPTETVITTGFAIGWSGTLKYAIDQEGRLQINLKDMVKTSDILNYELVYQFPAILNKYLGNSTQVGFTSADIIVDNSSLTFQLEQNGRLIASSHGSVKTNVRKLLGTTIFATKYE